MPTKFPRLVFYLPALVLLYTSCEKSATMKSTQSAPDSLSILSYQVNGASAQVTISAPNVYVQFPDSVTNPGNLAATFSLSAGAEANINGVQQTSGVTTNNFYKAMLYTLTASGGMQTTWEVIGTNNAYTVDWGLGQWLFRSVSNNRSYNWYIDQSTTGICSGTNCGPSCAAMAVRCSDSTSTFTAAAARSEFYDSCGDWPMTDLTAVLSQNGVKSRLIDLGDSAADMWKSFTAQLDSGRIIIIDLYMSSILSSTSGSNSRVDQFLSDGFAHYIILKGYRQTDEDKFFEVYDPWSEGEVYADGTPKGEDRYYRCNQIYIGCLSDGGGTQLLVLPP